MTRQPHVLVVNIYFAPYTYGGATVVAEQVARALTRDHGFRVSAVSAFSRGDLAPYALIKTETDGIVNYLINLPHGRPYAETYDNPQVTELLDRLIRRLGPDLLHVHCVQDIGAGVIHAARRQNLPVILSTHDFWWICERQFMIRMDGTYCAQDPIAIENCRGCIDNMSRARTRDSILREAAASADLITFPSHFAHDLSQRSGLGARASMVWENGVHLPGPGFFQAQARRRAGGRLAFGFVGGPSQIKGWPIIRQAFERLKTDVAFDGYLVDGSLDGSWWRGVDISGMVGNWQVVERFDQDTLDDFYARIDVLLFMSQWKETFGLTIREALARGIRVIQTDSGGTTEHAAADPARLIPIGAGPQRLMAEIERVLAAPEAHPQPLAVTSFAEQASGMAAQMRKLIAGADPS